MVLSKLEIFRIKIKVAGAIYVRYKPSLADSYPNFESCQH